MYVFSEVVNNELFRSSFFYRQGYANIFAKIAYVYNFCKGPVYLKLLLMRWKNVCTIKKINSRK